MFSGVWYRLMGFTQEQPIAHLPEQVIERITPRDAGFKDISFTFAAIALSARVATASGELNREKYIAFRASFPLTGGICGKIRKLFALACSDPTPYEHYVTQIKHVFPRQMSLFISLLDRLFYIAAASGEIGREEERMLARIAHMLGISASEYSELRDRYARPLEAHKILGVQKRPKSALLKKRYHALMREVHPDRFATERVSPEVEMLLRLKASEINHAYKILSKKAA